MTISSTLPRRFPGRLWLAMGLGLAALGVIAYVVQIAMQRLLAPWYMPILATLGVVLLIVSLRRKRTLCAASRCCW